jgi:hemerythrin-like domain-containing protein
MSELVSHVRQWMSRKKTAPMEPVGPEEIAEAKAYLQAQVSFDIDEFLKSQTIEVLFSSPLGPTPDCLSINEIAALAEGGALSARRCDHAENCESCCGDVRLYQQLRADHMLDHVREAGGAPQAASKSVASARGGNVITMLKSDHARIKRLLRELAETSERTVKQRETLVAQIERELKMHAQLEEEIFYPAFKAASRGSEAEDLFYEAAEEHHIVDMVLPALKSANPKSKEFAAKASVLKELVEHHIKEEEGEMFAEARSLFSDDQLRELGDMTQARKDSVEAMWDNPMLRPVKKLQSVAHKFMPTKAKTARAAKAATREFTRMTDK